MCTYCGCQSIGPIRRFMAEHVAVINATGDLRRACEAGAADDVRAHAATVASLLDPHTAAEEVGLFAVMAEQDEFADHIHTLCGEHSTLDTLLASVAAGDFTAVAAFEDALRHHIEKEDNGLFPAAAIALSGPDWERVVEQQGIPGDVHQHDHSHTHGGDHHHHHAHSHQHA